MGEVIRSGRRYPWWSPLATVCYLVLITAPGLYLSIVVWEESGADVIGQPVQEHATGIVGDCHKDGMLWVHRWWECDVSLDPPPGKAFAKPVIVHVQPPDLQPADSGRHVKLEERAVRGHVEWTTQRERPADLYGFLVSVLLVGGPAAGLVVLLRRLSGQPPTR